MRRPQILRKSPNFFKNYLVTSKQNGRFFQILVAFSEYLNFINGDFTRDPNAFTYFHSERWWLFKLQIEVFYFCGNVKMNNLYCLNDSAKFCKISTILTHKVVTQSIAETFLSHWKVYQILRQMSLKSLHYFCTPFDDRVDNYLVTNPKSH